MINGGIVPLVLVCQDNSNPTTSLKLSPQSLLVSFIEYWEVMLITNNEQLSLLKSQLRCTLNADAFFPPLWKWSTNFSQFWSIALLSPLQNLQIYPFFGTFQNGLISLISGKLFKPLLRKTNLILKKRVAGPWGRFCFQPFPNRKTNPANFGRFALLITSLLALLDQSRSSNIGQVYKRILVPTKSKMVLKNYQRHDQTVPFLAILSQYALLALLIDLLSTSYTQRRNDVKLF